MGLGSKKMAPTTGQAVAACSLQLRRWPPSPALVAKARPQSQRKFPLSSRLTAPVAPLRYLPEQLAHRVLGPAGPGPLPVHSSALHSHQAHRHLPPSHRRLCELSAGSVSKVRSHEPHTNLPCSLVVGGPLAPPRKRAEHAEQSVFAPLGPGPWRG